jgi:N-acetylneuraminic acid mutarotase
MTRRPALSVPLLLSLLALAACGETTTPTDPGTAGAQSLVTTSVAWPSNSWTARAPMPEEFWRFELAAGVVKNVGGESTVYVLGGRYHQMPLELPATRILAYNVATNTWTKKTARFTGAATNGIGTIGGKLYVSGGADLTGDPDHWKQASPRLFAYDVVRDRMVRKADMPAPTSEGVTGVINGKLYVLAGSCFEGVCNVLYRYDPGTNAWKTLARAPRNHARGAGVVIAGKFYVAGGGLRPYRSIDVYDPVTNAWRTLGLMPPRRDRAVGAVLGGKFYVIGVSGSRGEDRNTLRYDPVLNKWSNRAPFPEGEITPDTPFAQYAPQGAVQVKFEGRTRILTVGSGIILTNGTIKPAPSQMYTP